MTAFTIAFNPVDNGICVLSKPKDHLNFNLVADQASLNKIAMSIFNQLQGLIGMTQDEFFKLGDKASGISFDQVLTAIFTRQLRSLKPFSGGVVEEFYDDLIVQVPVMVYKEIHEFLERQNDLHLIRCFNLFRKREYIHTEEYFDSQAFLDLPIQDKAKRVRQVLMLHIKDFEKIERLDLSGDLLRVLPPELPSLFPNVKQLILRDNRFCVIPSNLSQFSQLEELDLSCNNISFVEKRINKPILYPDLQELKRLKKLNLRHNEINYITPQIFSLKQLQELDLSNNKITSIPREVCYLTNLQKLNLSSNKLDNPYGSLEYFPLALTELKQLRELDLSGNAITSIPSEIAKLQQLQRLDLRRNKLISISDELAELQQLQYLNITLNKTLIGFPLSETLVVYLTELDQKDCLRAGDYIFKHTKGIDKKEEAASKTD